MRFIGHLPERLCRPDTPFLNTLIIPRISYNGTDTIQDKVAKIEAAQATGQVVIACGRQPATDRPMLDAADHGAIIGNSYSQYSTVTADQMVDLVLAISYYAWHVKHTDERDERYGN